VIAARGLRLRLDGRQILDGVSFEVARGESVALTGANGSGKTSILRCLLGLVPFEGAASVDGHDVVREPIAARSLVGYLPQKPAFGDATAEETLAFAARLRRLDRTRIAPLLDQVGLGAHARERVRTFSGGMQQRLSLALALLTDAPVLLLDEPTASLDREGQAAFLEMAEVLRQGGRTLLLASHRPDEVARLADRVLHLDGGRLLDEPGEPDKPDEIEARAARVLPFVPAPLSLAVRR
jgi:ABC-type multidrug transport system ATPase subunit